MSEAPLEVSCQEVKSLLDERADLMLIDCREPQEHEVVKLSAAVLIPMQEIPSRREQIVSREGRVIVYCHHGMRSANTAQWLRANGVPEAQSMAGGIDQWALEIDPSLPRY